MIKRKHSQKDKKKKEETFYKEVAKKEPSMAKGEGKVVAQNKKARHDYTT